MKKIFVLLLLLCSGYVHAQYKVVGDKVLKVDTSSTKTQPIKTGLVLTIKGVDYPVYKGKKGGHFIVRISRKSGKQYKQYIKIER